MPGIKKKWVSWEEFAAIQGGNWTPSPHVHPRSDITDFWSEAFWENIPDKPSTFTPSSHALVGAKHTASGLTIGHVVRASGAAAFAWAQLQHSDLGGVTADLHHPQSHTLASHSTKPHSALTGVTSDQHHAQLHEASHRSGGGDALNHDNLAGFVAAEHLSLPSIIANVLTNHDLGTHTALGLFDSSSDVDHDQTTNVHQFVNPGSSPTFFTLTLTNVAAGVADYDKFVAIDGSNVLKYRTGAQLRSDIGAVASGHTHVKADITNLPWAWTDIAKTGSNLSDLVTRPHSQLSDAPADAHHPQIHGLTHAAGGSDGISVDVPSDIGTSNQAGTQTNFVRRDHVHKHPSGLGADLHHPQAHTLASHSSKAHSELTGIGANDHHAQVHDHVRADITDTPWLWTEISKVDSNLTHLVTRNHSALQNIGNDDHHAKIHGLTHAAGGSDGISVGIPSNIGTSNAAGTETNFVRRDHVHAHPSGLGANLHHPQSHTLASHSTKPHSALTSVTSDQHHAQIHASAHEVGGGDLIDHDSLTGYYASEHLALPNTIANVLNNHTKAIHDALALDHGALGGKGDDDHTIYYNAARHTKAVHDALGINADLLDSYHATTERDTPSTIPVRDGSGYIHFGWINTTSGNSGTNTPLKIYGSHSGDYIRYYTPANFATVMKNYFVNAGLVPTAGAVMTGAIVARDHGSAATDEIVNVCYGTGSPPVASTTTIGTLWIKYTA